MLYEHIGQTLYYYVGQRLHFSPGCFYYPSTLHSLTRDMYFYPFRQWTLDMTSGQDMS